MTDFNIPEPTEQADIRQLTLDLHEKALRGEITAIAVSLKGIENDDLMFRYSGQYEDLFTLKGVSDWGFFQFMQGAEPDEKELTRT